MVTDDTPLEIEVEASASEPAHQLACPACGAQEAHYVPPRLGKDGYFTCREGEYRG